MFRMVRFFLALPGMAVFCLAALAQSNECSVAQAHPLAEEHLALIHGDLQQAETLYRQKVALQPKDYELTAGLVRTLLAEQKVDEGASTVKAALVEPPQSVELLTALAEVQYRQGIPWDEQKTLDAALKADPCYARLHLVFARYYLFNSYYATALREIRLAHQLDPYDPEIRRMWITDLPLKQRIEELQKYLAEGNTDADGLKRGQRELSLLEGRVDNKGTCRLVSSVTSTEMPFSTAFVAGANYLRGWEMDVYLNNGKSRLQIETGSSGIYVSRSVAEHSGLKPIALFADERCRKS